MQQQVNQLISLVAGGIGGVKHLANQKAMLKGTTNEVPQETSMDHMIYLADQMRSDPKYSKFAEAFKQAMGDKYNNETINQETHEKVKEMVKNYSTPQPNIYQTVGGKRPPTAGGKK